jgi:hypothetical protein
VRRDWIAELSWRLIALGALIGVLTPALLSGLLLRAGLADVWVLMLFFSELSVLLAGFIAALGASTRSARLIHGVAVALICAALSFVVGVAVDSRAGANLAGILFLLITFTVMGGLGALVSGLLPGAR